VQGLQQIYRSGVAYKKAGVLLMGLVPSHQRQLNLFENNIGKHDALMQAIDKIHRRFGPHRMKLANQDLKRTWKMKQEHLSKRYTTEIGEIIRIGTKKN